MTKKVNKTSRNNSGHRQRLVNRFLNNGLDGFQDYEIIELLLVLNNPRKDKKQESKELLDVFGSLRAVLEADPLDLQKITGIGPKNIFGLKISQAVARRFLADSIIGKNYLRSSADVFTYLQHALRDRKREVFLVIFLNGQNQIIKMEELFEGSLTSSAVYPREVVKRALFYDAAALVFVHNHPSGNPEPSRDDLSITDKLIKAAEAIDISVHDHLIIAGQKIISFADKGLLKG